MNDSGLKALSLCTITAGRASEVLRGDSCIEKKRAAALSAATDTMRTAFIVRFPV